MYDYIVAALKHFCQMRYLNTMHKQNMVHYDIFSYYVRYHKRPNFIALWAWFTFTQKILFLHRFWPNQCKIL